MLLWIFAGIIVYYVAVLSPSLFLIPQIGLASYLGTRDSRPDMGTMEARLRRAVDNLRENFPVFLALAVLTIVVPETDQGLAVTGAATFVIARAAYHAVYLLGIPVLRSTLWTVGAVGMGIMAFAIV